MEIYRGCTVALFLWVLLFAHASNARAFDIEGTVRVNPPWPQMMTVEVKKDQSFCGQTQESRSLMISKEGNLENALVWLEGSFEKAGPLSSPPILNQKNCHFDPHILLVPQGQSFLIGNADPIGHDVRIFDGSHMLFRFDIDPDGKPVEKILERPGRFVIRCGLHKWMHAFVVSMDHPRYAVSDGSGKFQLKDVPKGSYKLRIWHERFGDVEVPIEVSKSVSDFSYTFPSASTG